MAPTSRKAAQPRETTLLASKTRAQGGSIITTLPAEVARRLAVGPDQVLYWRATRPGEYSVSVLDQTALEALSAHEQLVEQYRDVFAALAK